jgi:hypothetical protein
MIRPRTSEFDAVTKAVFDQPVVDELAAVVHIQRSQGKGQARANTFECLDHERAFSHHDGRGLRPSACDIGQNQAVNVATAIDLPAMSHKVHFHAARKRAHSSQQRCAF